MRRNVLAILAGRMPVVLCGLLCGTAALPAWAKGDAKATPPKDSERQAVQLHGHGRIHPPLASARHRHRHVAHHRDAPGDRQVGKATWYGPRHFGHRTATGERFDPNKLTAAHPSLPMNTRVRVRNLANGRVVTVRINDRSGQTGDRIIDLSPRAADILGMRNAGVAHVIVEKIAPELASAR